MIWGGAGGKFENEFIFPHDSLSNFFFHAEGLFTIFPFFFLEEALLIFFPGEGHPNFFFLNFLRPPPTCGVALRAASRMRLR